MPDRYAVIGNPVAHSKSPAIHAAFARETHQDLTYVALLAEIGEFETIVERFRADGGRGLNVTLPFKHRAFALARDRTQRAVEAQAANTLTFRDGAIAADNTDGVGLVRDLTVNLGCTLKGARILLLGAGGAAYGVCGPLLDEKPARLFVANRTADKALALRERFRASRGDVGLEAGGYDELPRDPFDIVINATSAGLSGEAPPLPHGLFGPRALAYDMVYGRLTPFLEFAKREGAPTADGLGMLVEQAAESFFIWRGVRPQTRPVIALLRDGK
ncbi:MAG: shikimate dehydrogenase [Burkholderiales bacterium]